MPSEVISEQKAKLVSPTPKPEQLLYENELTKALIKNAPQSLLTLIEKAHNNRLISDKVKTQFELLDPNAPHICHHLMCRYLLLHVHKNINEQEDLMCWLKLLSTVEIPGNVLSIVRKRYDSLVSISGEGNDGERIKEFQIPALTEFLAGCSSKWEVIAISLGLPDNKIKNIAAKNASKPVEVALYEVQ